MYVLLNWSYDRDVVLKREQKLAARYGGKKSKGETGQDAVVRRTRRQLQQGACCFGVLKVLARWCIAR